MRDSTLTMVFNSERLGALNYHMEKKEADLQAEMNDYIQKLYEKYVPQNTREYLDDKIAREEKGKPPRTKKPRPKDGAEDTSGMGFNENS
ncbi:DUF6103 family protein [Hungatella effluvii]|uniref:DUF6103 family protein n=1 Tax=Hungatella effluvii TaxID=1096246 RepID=UPI0022DEEB35|nr:DUF6103 family protein [Hungatella effluvii]